MNTLAHLALLIIAVLAVAGPLILWALLRRSSRRHSAAHVRVPRIGVELPSGPWMVASDAPRDVRRVA